MIKLSDNIKIKDTKKDQILNFIQNKKGRWRDTFFPLFLFIFFYLGFRCFCFEPFVIPSGSMEQTLLVKDYVLVKKWAYGFRVPFTESWILGPRIPKRGDIVVFKDKNDSNRFIVKRVIGLPGEKISMDERGVLSIDGNAFEYQKLKDQKDEDLLTMLENNGEKSYRVQYFSDMEQEVFSFKIPENEIFMMGDNRNQSSDSRYWGSLPVNRLLGQLVLIWLSCEESDDDIGFLCSPKNFRFKRLFRQVQ